MKYCEKSRTKSGFIVHFFPTKKICEIHSDFIRYISEENMSFSHIKLLHEKASVYKLDWNDVTKYIQNDAQKFLENKLLFYKNKDIVTQQDKYNFKFMCEHLLHSSKVSIFLEQFSSIMHLSEFRQGKLPVISDIGIYFGNTEVCHYSENNVVYENFISKKNNNICGHLVLTSRKLLFRTDSGGWEIPYKKFISIENKGHGVYIELSMKKGQGLYITKKSTLLEAALDAIILKEREKSVIKINSNGTREFIPDNVKKFVWQRDNGRCVKCGSQKKLEYDHIIPFSKGGSNTARNLQLLCEYCNRSKGANLV